MNCIFYFPIHLSRWSTDNQPCDRFNDIVWNAYNVIYIHTNHIYIGSFLSWVTKFFILWSVNSIVLYQKYCNNTLVLTTKIYQKEKKIPWYLKHISILYAAYNSAAYWIVYQLKKTFTGFSWHRCIHSGKYTPWIIYIEILTLAITACMSFPIDENSSSNPNWIQVNGKCLFRNTPPSKH